MTEQHIVVEDLRKSFRVSERRAGTLGALAGLVKRRVRTVHALDGVSFTVGRGELVGYIGPNGAGKSTTVKILAGILVPDAGRCEVLGQVPWKHRIETVARIGVVFGQRTQLWWDLPVVESFDLLRDIYRVERGAYRQALEELVALLDLAPLMNVPVRQLSLGQRMRCDLAASLLHSPALLYLDEPTIGLDAVSKLAVREFVMRKNRQNGTTVILTTHDMDDIEALCSRIILIHQGLILYDGSVEGLRARVTNERELIIDLKEPVDVTDPAALAVSRDGLRVRVRFDPQSTPAAELIARVTARWAVTDLMVENQPIEQIVARLYRQLEAGAQEAGAPKAGGT
jgi:ABC-2 type transport system ATP-binding protein